MNRTAEWSIQQLARITGTTSRTLRHYDSIGLLTPSRIGSGGYRHYDQAALVRLQRILLLRELGLGLAAIAEVLAGDTDTESALATHLELLEQEHERLRRRIASVRTTVGAHHVGQDEKRRTTDGRGDVRRIRPHPLRGRSGRTVGEGRVRTR